MWPATTDPLWHCRLEPSRIHHPTIYHTKLLLASLIQTGRTPVVFCDFHGHSRKKMVFMYGCGSPPGVFAQEQLLPRLLGEIAPAFHYKSGSFKVEKVCAGGEGEGRCTLVVFREHCSQ